MIAQIFLIVYIVLASTVGAWWLAGGDKKEITLLDLIACILPSILLVWMLVPFSLLDRIKIKKFK
jgi:hypothetical protein